VPEIGFRGTASFTFRVFDSHGKESAPSTIQITIGTPLWYPYFTWDMDRGSQNRTVSWYNVQVFDGTGTAALASAPIIDTNVTGTAISPMKYFRAGNEGLLPGDYTYRAYTWDPATGEKGALVTDTATFNVIDYGVANPTESMTAIETGSNTGAYTLSFIVPNARGYEAVVSGPNGWTASYRNIFRPDPITGVIPLNQPVTLNVKLTAVGEYSWKVRGFNPQDELNGITTTTPDWTTAKLKITVATPASPTGALTAPDGLLPPNNDQIPAPDGSARITLQWNPVAGAESYILYLCASNAAPVYSFVNVGNVTNLPRVPLKPGSYYWTIRAVNAAGAGPASVASFFDVIKDATAPAIASVSVKSANTLTLGATTPAVAFVDIQHYDNFGAGHTYRWSVYINQAVSGNEVVVTLAPTDSGFTAGEYILIRTYGTNGAVSDYKWMILQ